MERHEYIPKKSMDTKGEGNMTKEKMIPSDADTLDIIINEYKDVLFIDKQVSGVAGVSSVYFFKFNNSIILSRKENFRSIL